MVQATETKVKLMPMTMGKPAAHPPQREQLHEGADAGDEHGVLNERGPANRSGRPAAARTMIAMGARFATNMAQDVLEAVGEGRKPADLAIKGR